MNILKEVCHIYQIHQFTKIFYENMYIQSLIKGKYNEVVDKSFFLPLMISWV